MRMERRDLPATVVLEKRDDGQPGKIRGVAAVYFNPADQRTEYQLWDGAVERIMPGAFDRAIKEDDVRGLFNHDAGAVLGRTKAGTLTLESRADGLHYEIAPSETSVYRDVAEHLRRGDVDGSSFAFRVREENWRKEGEGRNEMEIREIRQVELFDVGPVTYPAYGATSAGFRSADGLEEACRSHEAWLKVRGDQAAADQAVAAILCDLARDS